MLIDWFRVTPVSDGHPVALADSYDVSQKALDVSPAKGVLANDEGKGAQPKVTLLSKPEHGTLELREDGSFRYTPKSGFRGIDNFAYIAHVDKNESNAATVTLRVDP